MANERKFGTCGTGTHPCCTHSWVRISWTIHRCIHLVRQDSWSVEITICVQTLSQV